MKHHFIKELTLSVEEVGVVSEHGGVAQWRPLPLEELRDPRERRLQAQLAALHGALDAVGAQVVEGELKVGACNRIGVL